MLKQNWEKKRETKFRFKGRFLRAAISSKLDGRRSIAKLLVIHHPGKVELCEGNFAALF